MIVMEGLMLVPPERGTIIGRAVWKQRYVVLGSGSLMKTQNDILAQSESGGRLSTARKGLKATSRKPSLVDVLTESSPESQGLYISIYKAKGDWEFISQHPISSFSTCEIRTLQHRKQGPSLPTLMLEFKADPAMEKQRRRRSSRTGGLSSKDPWLNTLLFRTCPEERYNIYDWHIAVKPKLTPETVEETPFSPMSPLFAGFTNPFSPREAKPPPLTTPSRPEFQHRSSSNNTSTYPHAPRDRPSALASPSPSLRSRRSDLSSQASSQHPPMAFTTNNIHPSNFMLPTDLPSPASTSGYDNQFIEGWTSAQGRSSALSSHTRGSNSIASAVAPSAILASSPPGPRETILDRAFQMRCIPGSERLPDDEILSAKISSIARFEALMREVDEKKASSGQSSRKGSLGWDCDGDGSSSASPIDKDIEEEEEDDDDANGLELSDHELELDVEMPSPAQRALQYISGRNPGPNSRPLSPTPRSPPIPFLNSQAMSAFYGGNESPNGGLRPRTGGGHSSARESVMKQRMSRPTSLALPSRSMSTSTVPGLRELSLNANAGSARDSIKEKRRSSTSVSAKRLSFTEFAKRLSSTSSLLLVQSNASGGGSSSGERESFENGGSGESEERGVERSLEREAHRERDRLAPGSRVPVGLRGGGGGSGWGLKLQTEIGDGRERERGLREREKEREKDLRNKRCGWRGSVGVFGEGGFL